MTDPTRAEVERPIDEQYDTMMDVEQNPTGAWMAIQSLAAENQSLRERAEAAEAERKAADFRLVDRYRNPKTGIFNFPDDVAAIVRALDAARRGEAAAWNDAIEAISDDDLIAAMMAIEEMELQDRWFEKWRGTMDEWKGEHFGDCTNAPISCLRCAYEAARERLPGFKAVLHALRRAAPAEGEA